MARQSYRGERLRDRRPDLWSAMRQTAGGANAGPDRPSTEAVDEPDAEGIVAFAERILTHASDLRVQASLDYKQPLQQLFLPEVVTFDGNRFNRTAVTAPLFKWWLPESRSAQSRQIPSLIWLPRAVISA